MGMERRKFVGGAEHIEVSHPVVINVPLNLHNVGF